MNEEARHLPDATLNERDEELREQVYQALNHEYPPFRELLLPIGVEVRDGEVILTGWVRTVSMKRMATIVAEQVPGVRTVQNQLVADDELKRAVSLALEQEPSLQDDFPGIHVDTLAGAVILWGEVSTGADRDRAAGVAENVPGVRKVVNDLRVREGGRE